MKAGKRTGLALVCLLFLMAAGQFFWVTPILEGPDSYEHFRFVRYLVATGHFPRLNDPDRSVAPHQEAAQFPLYYLLGAAASFPISTADFDQTVRQNPHAGDMRGNGNANFLFHRPFSGFPHGTELAARIVALLSLLCGLVTVTCAVRLGWLAAPKRRWLGLAAGAALAAAPPFVAFSSYVTNDDLVTALSSVSILLLALWVERGGGKWAWLAAVGIALAILAKFNAVGLLVPYALALLLVDRSWRARCRDAGKLALAIGIVDGWWLIRNQLLYSDFSGMLAVNGHVADPEGHAARPPQSLSGDAVVETLSRILHGLFSTGAYGIDSPPALYLVTTALGLIGLVAGVVVVLGRLPKQPWLSLILVWPLLNLLELVAYALAIALPGAREFFPAIACVALLVAVGWSELLGKLRLRPVGWLALAGGITVTALVPQLVVAPAYARPPVVAAVPPSATPMHALFAGAAELVGAESDASGYLQPDRPYGLTLFWRLVRPTNRWLDTFVHLDSLDPTYLAGASYDGATGRGNYPPNFWQPGQIVVDRYQFKVRSDTRPDKRNAVPLAVRVGMYDEDHGKIAADPPEAGDRGLQVALWKLAGQPPAPSTAAPVASFEGGLQLLTARAEAIAGGLVVHLQWRAEVRPAQNFTVFVQLLSSDGHVIAQHDSYPLDGRYPTSAWWAGERVFDRVALSLHEPPRRGDRLVTGIYVLPDARPVPTTAGAPFATVPLG